MPDRREAVVERNTNETKLRISVDLDGSGRFSGSLGIPFFEHMLNLFARHALIDLQIEGRGDIEVDAHHTVEDVGIVLGSALKQALGDKAGIERYGTAFIPMEETLARCVLDFCNRPYLQFEAGLPKAKVGTFDVELAEEFFRALAFNAGLTMHLDVLRGGNLHHVLEAMFKACGSAVRQAVTVNPGIRGVLSTKGTL